MTDNTRIFLAGDDSHGPYDRVFHSAREAAEWLASGLYDGPAPTVDGILAGEYDGLSVWEDVCAPTTTTTRTTRL